MKIINKYSLENKKAAAWCNDLISFVNLIFDQNTDLTDENNTTFLFYKTNLISFFDLSATVKYLSVVLYDKFNRLAITY